MEIIVHVVWNNDGIIKLFTSLSEARKFYDRLDKERCHLTLMPLEIGLGTALQDDRPRFYYSDILTAVLENDNLTETFKNELLKEIPTNGTSEYYLAIMKVIDQSDCYMTALRYVKTINKQFKVKED